MGSLILKLVYILTALSIVTDLLHFGGFRFNAEQYGAEISGQSSALFLPGASGVPVWPWVARGAVVLTKSAIKAAKRKAKNQAKKAGKAKNKAKKTKGGAGMWYEEEIYPFTPNARLYPKARVRVKGLIDSVVIAWGEHDNPIKYSVQSMPSFQAPRPYSVFELLQTQTEVSSFADFFKNV